MADEELVLRVRLEDLATPKLRQIRTELAQIGGGPNNLPKLTRELGALQTSVKPLAADIDKSSAAMLGLARSKRPGARRAVRCCDGSV